MRWHFLLLPFKISSRERFCDRAGHVKRFPLEFMSVQQPGLDTHRHSQVCHSHLRERLGCLSWAKTIFLFLPTTIPPLCIFKCASTYQVIQNITILYISPLSNLQGKKNKTKIFVQGHPKELLHYTFL